MGWQFPNFFGACQKRSISEKIIWKLVDQNTKIVEASKYLHLLILIIM